MAVTRRGFAEDLASLQADILHMAEYADDMVGRAVDALVSGDVAAAESVIADDDRVDRLDVEIEERSLRLIARQQPVARDLRVVGTALKIITDIERIADYAVDIAGIGARLARAGMRYRDFIDLPGLAADCQAMLASALRAFVLHDLDLADSVIEADSALDARYGSMREELIRVLQARHADGLLAVNIMFAAKYTERIGDHVVNMAERVIFIETGAITRSHSRNGAGSEAGQ